MFDRYPPKSVIVGVDGSQAAIRAARWAVDEVAGTDIPLLLLYVTQPNPGAGRREARAALLAAEEVVHEAYRAVDEMGRPLKVETEIIHGDPVQALIAASRDTRLICVGDKGSAQHPDTWLGSTAIGLARSGHCSVAIIRGDDAARQSRGGYIVARVDESADDLDVLDLAINEALRRHAPLRVVTTAQSRSSDIPGDRKGCVALEALLRRVEDEHPGLGTDVVRLEDSFLDYLATHAASIRLVMLSSAQTGEMQRLLGPGGQLALHGSDCSVFVVGLERLGH